MSVDKGRGSPVILKISWRRFLNGKWRSQLRSIVTARSAFPSDNHTVRVDVVTPGFAGQSVKPRHRMASDAPFPTFADGRGTS